MQAPKSVQLSKESDSREPMTDYRETGRRCLCRRKEPPSPHIHSLKTPLQSCTVLSRALQKQRLPGRHASRTTYARTSGTDPRIDIGTELLNSAEPEFRGSLKDKLWVSSIERRRVLGVWSLVQKTQVGLPGSGGAGL